MNRVLKKNKDLLLRIGLGSFFLVNSLTAWLAADEFKDAISGNSLTSHIGHVNVLVYAIGINDALLFLLILSGRYRKLAAAWASLWMVAVIFVTGFWTTDFIEHLGVLALAAYYAIV